MEPISALVAAGLLGVGWLLGRHARLKTSPRAAKPWCLCEHHYGQHHPETGVCQAREKERFQPNPGGFTGDVWVTCSCVRYTGPQPVEQYWVPPAADMNIVTAPRQIGDANA